MSALPRLLEDPSASERLRGDLLRAQAHAVAPFDTAAGLVRLRAGMKGGSGPSAPPGGTTVPGSSWKLLAALGVAGIVGWALLSGNPKDREPAPVFSPSSAAPIAEVREKSESAAAPPVTEAEAQPSVAIESQRLKTVHAEPTRAPAPPPVSQDNTHSFADEIAHLGALRQLQKNDPASAVISALEGHEKFAQGLLYEEREALLILSLKEVGRSAEAERRAAGFRTRFPRSAFLSKMQQMVPAPQEPPGATE